MDTKTKEQFEVEAARLGVEYFRYAMNYGHDYAKAAFLYDQLYHLGELGNKIKEAAKEKEAKPVEDPD